MPHGPCSDPAPGRGLSRLTTTYCGWLSPETRDAVLLQHCSYALVNQRRATSVQVTGRSRLFACGSPRPAHPAAPIPRERLASALPWPRSSPSMRARPACAPSWSTSRPGWPTSPTGSSPSTSPGRAGSSTTPPRSGRRCGPPWPRSGGRLAEADEAVAAIGITNQRETLVAFDRSTGRPLHRAIVWQDRRTAPSVRRARRRRATCRWCARTTGLVLDPYFTRDQVRRGCSRQGDLALAASDPDLSFCTVDTWVLWNLTGGAAGGTYATDPSNASRTLLLDTAALAWSAELCDLFGVPAAHPARGAPLGRPLRHRRARRTSAPPSAVLDGRAGLGRARRPAGRALRAGLLRPGHGQGHLRHRQLRARQRRARPAPRRPTASPSAAPGISATPRAAALARAPSPTRSRARRSCRAPRIQWLRDGLGHHRVGRGGRAAGRVGPRQRRRHLRAGPHRPRQPVVGPRGRAASSPGSTRGAGRAQIARACVEAMAFQVRDMTDAMAAASAHPLSALRADGGAAAMDLLLELQAEQSRMPVARPRSLESTALGRRHRGRPGRGGVVVARRAGRALGGRGGLRAAAAGRADRRRPRRLAPGGREVDGVGRPRSSSETGAPAGSSARAVGRHHGSGHPREGRSAGILRPIREKDPVSNFGLSTDELPRAEWH